MRTKKPTHAPSLTLGVLAVLAVSTAGTAASPQAPGGGGVTVVACGSDGPPVTMLEEGEYIEVSSGHATEEEAKAVAGGGAGLWAHAVAIDDALSSYLCAVCPPPQTDHCDRSLRSAAPEYTVEPDAVPEEGGTYKAVVRIATADAVLILVCKDCGETF